MLTFHKTGYTPKDLMSLSNALDEALHSFDCVGHECYTCPYKTPCDDVYALGQCITHLLEVSENEDR